MTVRFFRVNIEGTDLAKLESIKAWLETKIENNDLSDSIVPEGVSISELEIDSGNYLLSLDLYLKTSVSINKYKDIIVNQFTGLNKTGLTSAKVIQYDNCSHDSATPSPCSPDVRMSWVSP